MGTVPLCGSKALFGILLETNAVVTRDTYTLMALCFRPQPRGGPELLGALLLGGLPRELEQIQSTLEQGSEQGSSARMECQGARAGSERPQARVGAGRILLELQSRSAQEQCPIQVAATEQRFGSEYSRSHSA